MKHHHNKRPEEDQSRGPRWVAVKDLYTWLADDAILERWGKYLEAARAGRLADRTPRGTS